MSALRGQVAIVGAADTAVGKLPGHTPMDLAAEAALDAIADAGLTLADVDGLVTCNAMAQPLMYPGEALAEYLQIYPKFLIGVGAGGGTTFSILQHAAAAIATGQCDTVLVTMADCLRTGLSREQSMVMQSASGHPEFERPYGATVPAYYALAAQAHMHQFGTTAEDFAHIAVICREHACANPAASMQKPLQVEDVLASPMIADPLRMLDCSLVSDGGAAVVLTSAERARDLPNPPAYVLGVGEGYGHEHISQARSLSTSSAVLSSERAYEMAQVNAAGIDFIELYDCFTPVVLIELEDLGFCDKGAGGQLARSGRLRAAAAHEGRSDALPMNTHGGLLSHAHPGNPGSMFALTEAVKQIQRRAGDRQLPRTDRALLHAQGGILSSHCTLILGSEAAL